MINTRDVFNFLHLINKFVIVAWNFLLVLISANQVIKSNENFSVSIWIVIINIVVNIIHRIWIFYKCFWIIRMFHSCIFTFFFIKNWYFGSFKVGLSPSKQNCVICFIESPLKIMKNAFYFILKALFILKIFKFLSWLFGQVRETAWLER